jgi:hypothetical protein
MCASDADDIAAIRSAAVTGTVANSLARMKVSIVNKVGLGGTAARGPLHVETHRARLACDHAYRDIEMLMAFSVGPLVETITECVPPAIETNIEP